MFIKPQTSFWWYDESDATPSYAGEARFRLLEERSSGLTDVQLQRFQTVRLTKRWCKNRGATSVVANLNRYLSSSALRSKCAFRCIAVWRYVFGEAYLVEIRTRGSLGDEDLLGSLSWCFTAGKRRKFARPLFFEGPPLS